MPDPAPNPNDSAGGGAPAPAPANSGQDLAPGEGFNFVGWRDSIKDPKSKAAAERFNSAEDMLANNIMLRTEIADRVRLPGPNATPEDTTKFRRAIGVPDDIKGYEVKLPEGVTISAEDQGLIDMVRPIAHAANMSAKGFNELVNGMVAMAKEVEGKYEKALGDAAMLATSALKKEWSTEFDKNRELAYRTVHAFGGDELKKQIEDAHVEGFGRLGDWPPFLKLMAAVGKRADEGEMILGDGTGATAKQTARQELEALLAANPPGTEGYKAKQNEIQALYEKIHGKGAIVGNQQRTV